MIIIVFLIVGVCVSSVLFGHSVPLEKSIELLDSLLTMSSITFGLLGALLAIGYPEKIREGLRGKGEQAQKIENLEDAEAFSDIVYPLFESAFLMILVLVLRFAVPMIEANFSDSVTACTIVNFFIGLLVSWQIWILFRALVPVDSIQYKASKREASNRIRKSFRSLGKK